MSPATGGPDQAWRREAEERDRIRDWVHGLLAHLEQEVLLNGADEAILGGIERERREVWK